MALTYTDVGMHMFGEREFDAREFARRTGNPRAAKLLSELRIRGVVGRIRRGRYKFLRPSERPDVRSAEWERVRTMLLMGPDPKAWDGPTAVEVWTGGRYRVSPSLYSRVYHLAIPAGARADWMAYLADHRIPAKPTKRVGAWAELREVPDLAAVTLAGEPVLARADILALVRDHPGLYADAEGLLLDRSESS